MNRRSLLLSTVSLGLGIAIGGGAVYFYGKPPPAAAGAGSVAGAAPITARWTPATVFGEQLNLTDLFTAAKPREATFVIPPGGQSGLSRYGYDGHWAAVWDGPANPETVKEIIFKDLEARFQAKKWEIERGGGMSSNGNNGAGLATYDLRYRLPDYSAAGWTRVFIHQEGKRTGVMLTFNTGRDWPTD
jgi:hypothetical protein